LYCEGSEAKSVKKFRYTTKTLGPIELYADGSSARLSSVYGEVLITAHGKCIGYNESNKLSCEYSSPSAFMQGKFCRTAQSLRVSDDYFGAWQKRGELEIDGVTATKFERSFVKNDTSLKKFGQNAVQNFRQCVVATSAPQTRGDWLNPYFTSLGAPCPAGMLPLNFYTEQSNVIRIKRLTLIEISKVTVPDSFFDEPKGFKRMQDDVRVFVGGSGLDEVFYQTK
jgi:hypothetical protein